MFAIPFLVAGTAVGIFVATLHLTPGGTPATVDTHG